ncbi:ABC transporter permease, partial [Xanthomonas citri pv. citri]|nr:ABC transporter permease [Xanthomonas citri pv. citri]
PGVVFDQPLNIPAAFLCIGVWAAASAVLANVALVRRK